VVLLDYPAIREAAKLSADRQLSFWDSLILVAARRSGARRIYTEDLQDGQTILGVRVVNPFR
jgi:predicted nucleic acid-binding protein